MNTEPCADMQLLLQADQDGELSAAEAAHLQLHMLACPNCRAQAAFLHDLSNRLRREVRQPELPTWIRTAAKGDSSQFTAPLEKRTSRPLGLTGIMRRHSSLLALTLLICLVSAVSLNQLMNSSNGNADLADEAVAAHIRALQPGHLMDVVSTDRHTVKPWFAGKLDFSPPVRDFAAAGFPLRGGRLDYFGGHAVAALVYARDKHLIDLIVWPSKTAMDRSGTVNGYNFVAWHRDGMIFWAVSDLNLPELRQFCDLMRS